MKKSLFFGALFAVGMLMTACSSDKDVVENNVPTGENGGKKYIAIGINLPTNPASATRSGANDNAGQVTYADGLAVEYAVKNATLVIFNDAATEDDATFVGAYSINPSPWTGTGTSNNVTEISTKVVQQVSSSVVAGYRILVVLNHNDIMTVSATNGLSVNSTDLTTSTKYSEFRKMLTTAITTLDAKPMTTTGIFMANSPLSDGSGSTGSLISGSTRTLVPITATSIYDSETAAQSGTNYDQVFVERGVAKVTMAQKSGIMTASKIDKATPTTIDWQVTGWILDNTAPSTYLVRSTDGDGDFRNLKSNTAAGVYRYIGNTQINDGKNNPSGFYRTYFAKSVGYDKWAASQTYTLNTYASGDFYNTFGESNPKYCFENTFDVDHQKAINTTLIQVAIKATETGESNTSLYTLGGQKTVVYTSDLLIAKIKDIAYHVLDGDGVRGTVTTSDITVTIPTPVAGTVEVSTSNLKVVPDAGKVGTGYNETTFYTNLNAALGKVECYKDGVSYYSIRIKHFGDVLTPWNTTEYGSNTAPNSTTIYPNNASNRNGDYLGRYGVLRNNWYDISVSSVRSLGDATPHTGPWPDTPDDELNNYLAFHINVLSWAKRTQAADL